MQHASIFDLRIAGFFGFILKYSGQNDCGDSLHNLGDHNDGQLNLSHVFMFDQNQLIEKFSTKPRATFGRVRFSPAQD